MAVNLKFLDKGLGALFKGEGSINGEELLEAFTEFYKTQGSKFVKYSIIDFIDVKAVDVTNSEIEILSRNHRNAQKSTQDRVVAVAARIDIVYGLARVWEANIDSYVWERTIVRSRDEADIWVIQKVKEKFGVDVTIS